MASFRLLMFFFAAVVMGWSQIVAEDTAAESEAVSGSIRERRHLRRKKLCLKYGICEGFGGGHGGFQGGFQGSYQGGYQGGYGQPPINIAISQSQSSSNEGGGGHAQGYYPNNHQYNGGYPNHGGYQGLGGHGGYSGQGAYANQGGPGYFGNGQGGYNNQFNGNYYGPAGANGPNVGGGYGFQRPGYHGSFYDEGEEDVNKPEHDGHEEDEVHEGPGAYNDYNQGHHGPQGQNFAVSGAFSIAGRHNH